MKYSLTNPDYTQTIENTPSFQVYMEKNHNGVGKMAA